MNYTKNIFIVLTEYQLLQALNIAVGLYNNSENLNIIYVLRKGNRLNGFNVSDNNKIDNVEIRLIDSFNPRELVDSIIQEKPDHFLFFQAINAINIFLGYSLAKKGVQISLGPDGYGTYSKFKKKNWFLSFLRDTFKQNKYLIKNNLIANTILPFDYYSFGNHKFIDNVWVTHPDQYTHSSNHKVNICKLPDFNQKTIEFIKRSFDFEENFSTENEIYFFNQPFWGDLIQTEYDFLKKVIKQFPEKKIIIKLHPLTAQKVIDRYKALDNVVLINSNIPAEVILLNLKNCIVFSGWSTVLITENKKCNYYFNYPIYTKLNDNILNQIEIIALNHIKFINSAEEMQFPNG